MNMRGEGEILACDIHEKKLSAIEATAARLGLDMIETRSCDARIFLPEYEKAFDAVIADVPCSGFGVIRKKPEIRDKRPEELAALPEIQRDILENLSRYVRPGGILLYCTCTILREENEAVVEAFLSGHSDFSLCGFSVGGLASQSGSYTFYPPIDGTDGFFVSKLKRTAT